MLYYKMKLKLLLKTIVLILCIRVQVLCLLFSGPVVTFSQKTVTATCSTKAQDILESSADVRCPAGCLESGSSVWGTYNYTQDSSICRAAIQVGLISHDVGQVTVLKTPGQNSYTGSTRNSISSRSYGSYHSSFIFINYGNPVTPEITQKLPVTATCSTKAQDILESSADVRCPAGCLESGSSVWGTYNYTQDSSICRAAIQIGLISHDGGQVTVLKTPGQNSYTGSTRNGISSRSYGSYHNSFIFINYGNPVTPEITQKLQAKK